MTDPGHLPYGLLRNQPEEDDMEHLIFLVSYQNTATQPTGVPPSFTVEARSDEVTCLEGDPAAVPDWVTYRTEVNMTGETTLTEQGTLTLGRDGDCLHVATMGEGAFLPTPEAGVMLGTVMWQVAGGAGRFTGASGVVTGNFTHRMAHNKGREHQVVNIFVPDGSEA